MDHPEAAGIYGGQRPHSLFETIHASSPPDLTASAEPYPRARIMIRAVFFCGIPGLMN